MPKPAAALLSSPAVRKLARELSYVPTLDPHLYEPSAQRPVRSKMRELRRDTQVMPHSHPWAQMAISTGGVIRLSMDHATYIVPPSRAVWVPPGLPHAVTMVETARLYTLYFLPARDGAGAQAEWMEQPAWQQCRVLQASELLRALVQELSTDSDAGPPLSPPALQREHHLSALVCDELRRAQDMRLGIVMPRDKRLQHLCEAVLEQPTRHASLQEWALDTGASLRTVARLFRGELGCTFTQWHQQVVLAHAVALAARQMPIARIAAELNYTPSAFSAMVRRSVGMTPAAFLGQHRLHSGPG